MLYYIDKEGNKRWLVERISYTPDGYILVALFLHHGRRCGYVGVPENNILHGVGWQGYVEGAFEVHGGITFAGKKESLSKNHWFFGFDTAHSDDGIDFESMTEYGFEENIALEKKYYTGGTPRGLDYVWKETKNLYNQLKKYEEE